MKFSDGSINSIRSISQRGLAIYWARLEKVDRLPSFRQFGPEPRLHDRKQLAIWNIEIDGSRTVFRALYRGSLLDQAYNDGWVGRTLDEIASPALRPAVLSGMQECFAKQCAVYMILRTADDAGQPVDLERLLLPFGEGGQVKQIVASLQLISLKGAAERRKIIRQFDAKLDCVISITIPATSFGTSEQRTPNDSDRCDPAMTNPSTNVRFEAHTTEIGESWEVIATFQNADTESIVGFSTRLDATDWIDSDACVKWVKARGCE
jgi:hypothetical protein